MAFPEISISSPVEEKVEWAKACYVSVGHQLLRDERIGDLLIRYREAAANSHLLMAETGIQRECRGCEEVEGGSCCGRGLEDYYSGVLLLINLLLGRELPEGRRNSRDCLFLDSEGCRLLARHVICVNYLCKKIIDHIEPQKITLLRENEGIELETLFHLNERIKEFLREIGP